MAFSYSDNNFTVIGNLCFVHIIFDGTRKFYNIPRAIWDRMLFDFDGYIYPYYPVGETSRISSVPRIGFARILNSKIFLSDVGEGYLNFCFPIDSNK